MKTIFTIFSMLSLAILGSVNLDAQTFTLCGTSTFTIDCNGTVDVDLGDDVQIYKVMRNGVTFAELNNYNPGLPNVIYTPFNSADPGFGNVIPVEPVTDVYSVQVQTTSGCVDDYNITNYLNQNCLRFDLCGSTFNLEIDCMDESAVVDFNLLKTVEIFTVFNGGTPVFPPLNNTQ